MKIQNISNYSNYKGSTKPIKPEEHIKIKKYDAIEIKSKISKTGKTGKTGKTQKDIGASKLNSIKQKVVSQMNEETNAEKISRIKESINNNTYKIDVEGIVNKLLK